MKQLLLIRHAKSDWDDPSLSDFDRPLNNRGKKDAPEMAKRLREKKVNVDAFVTSPAKRAKKTATIFAKEFGHGKKDLILVDKLYEAGEDVFFDVIDHMKDKFDTIAIVAHNPGITGFANQLTETKIDNLATSAVFAIKVATKHWADFRDAKKEFWFVDYPKVVSL
jgi:phosphohistidine phosphatase